MFGTQCLALSVLKVPISLDSAGQISDYGEVSDSGLTAFEMLYCLNCTHISAAVHVFVGYTYAAHMFAVHVSVREVDSTGLNKNSRWRLPSANKDVAILVLCDIIQLSY